ncbi:3-isopropylmalate dehydratase small subunit [Alphaproteobacteria bacterium]|jgi:3-isopropylmalate dehydratase small subunit|nr:3-isopropylmalate dehydratase small subunit [Alphaproteobacteria bacterium]|tara:strand:- start:468 stop:1079 length:612 start_codon:yes stop_codon:yes gene_type:complete
MDKFITLKGIAAPLPIVNIDTDMIIPKQFLKTIKRTGLGISLFYEMRYDHQGQELKDFILNTKPFNQSKILVAGDNFGCGSSREHAPWSLKDFGISCIISTSFADIFYNNCFQNGILPIVVSPENSNKLMDFASDQKEFEIDLPSQNISVEGEKIGFDIEPYRKERLIEGLDDIGITMNYEQSITDYELLQKKNKPWIFKDIK